ncbi:MAG: prepilin-type N-terminal cleavage/methylation domain-containing protein [Acidobacteriota bacterium]
MNDNRRGLTIIELLVGVIIGMIIITSSFSIASSFLSRIEISGAVSTITSYLSSARYISLSECRKVRFKISGNEVLLQILADHKWKNFKSAEIKGEVIISSNASPVFSPTGTASPLCSIRVSSKAYCRIITLSFAGRIRVKDLKY